MRNTAAPLVIRQATSKDQPSVTELVQTSMQDSYPSPELGIPPEWFGEDIFADPGTQASFERQLTPDAERRAWVAHRSGNLAGVLTSKDRGDHVEVIKLHVGPSERGQKIGAQLMAWAIGWWGGDREYGLEVLNYNGDAIRFYKRFGFEIDHARGRIRYDDIPEEEFPAGCHLRFWSYWMKRKPGTIE